MFIKWLIPILFFDSLQVNMVCEMCPEGPCVYPRVEFSCFEYLAEGMQLIIEYFFYNNYSQNPYMTYPTYPQYNGTVTAEPPHTRTDLKKPMKDILEQFKKIKAARN